MNASGAREGIPEGPGPTHRVAGERGRFQPQLVDNLVEELDRSVSEPLARDLNGLAEPQPRPIHGDRSNTLEMIDRGRRGRGGGPVPGKRTAGGPLPGPKTRTRRPERTVMLRLLAGEA